MPVKGIAYPRGRYPHCSWLRCPRYERDGRSELYHLAIERALPKRIPSMIPSHAALNCEAPSPS